MGSGLPAKLRTVAYVRVSSARQRDEGLSLDAQRDQIHRYAELYDLALVEVIADEGASAKTLRRDGLQRALGLLASGTVDALIVAKLDRLTRSVRDLGTLLDGHFSTEAELISVAEQINTRSAGGRMVLNVLMSVAQWEREKISERVREVQAYKRSLGQHVAGRLPFGTRLAADGRTLERDPGEGPVLDLIFELRASGLSLRKIAQHLSENGTPARGKRWHATSIARLLKRADETNVNEQERPAW